MPKKRVNNSKFLYTYHRYIEDHLDGELWTDIDLGDYVIYEISNHGRVRRKDTLYELNPFHSYRKDLNGNVLYNRPTYLRVQLYYYENGVRKKRHFEISRLVAIYFIPVPKKYLDMGYTMDTLEVNHIHGGYEIYNNFSTNLEWCTQQENIDHAFKNDLRHPKFGESHHSTYMTEKEIHILCRCIADGKNPADSYEANKIFHDIDFDRFKHMHNNVKCKKSWKQISDLYF